MYGTKDFFLVFKLLATIYERLVKAQQLIRGKVEDDLKSKEVREIIGMTADDHETQAKFEAFKAKATKERFAMMVSAMISNMSAVQKLD